MDSPEVAEISDSSFRKLSELLLKRTGITLKDHKKYLMVHRLSKFVGADRPFSDFESYYQALLKNPNSSLMTEFVNVLTTNFSFFFREEFHFNFLKHYVRQYSLKEPFFRFWSAASSTGEEAYSMAISILQSLEPGACKDIRILGTDISTKVLQAAHRGIYEAQRIEGHLHAQDIKHYFSHDSNREYYEVKPVLKNLVSFRHLNLLGNYPFQKQFDVVFLRNVLIYFDHKEKEQVINQVYETIKPGGYLIIGLSESMVGVQHHFTHMKNSIYRKSKAGN